MTPSALRDDIATACRIAAYRGLCEDILGHISVRSGDGLLMRCRGPRERGLLFTDAEDVRQVAGVDDAVYRFGELRGRGYSSRYLDGYIVCCWLAKRDALYGDASGQVECCRLRVFAGDGRFFRDSVEVGAVGWAGDAAGQ